MNGASIKEPRPMSYASWKIITPQRHRSGQDTTNTARRTGRSGRVNENSISCRSLSAIFTPPLDGYKCKWRAGRRIAFWEATKTEQIWSENVAWLERRHLKARWLLPVLPRQLTDSMFDPFSALGGDAWKQKGQVNVLHEKHMYALIYEIEKVHVHVSLEKTINRRLNTRQGGENNSLKQSKKT